MIWTRTNRDGIENEVKDGAADSQHYDRSGLRMRHTLPLPGIIWVISWQSVAAHSIFGFNRFHSFLLSFSYKSFYFKRMNLSSIHSGGIFFCQSGSV